MRAKSIHNTSSGTIKCRSIVLVLILVGMVIVSLIFFAFSSNSDSSSLSSTKRKKSSTKYSHQFDESFSSSSSSSFRDSAKRTSIQQLHEQQHRHPSSSLMNRQAQFQDDQSASAVNRNADNEKSTPSTNSSDDKISSTSPPTVPPSGIASAPLVIENALVPTPFPNPPSWTFNSFMPPHQPTTDGMKIGITTILRKEHNYVSDWLKYHLAMGFDRIIIYDNEEEPTYANLIRQEGLSCCVVEAEYGAPLKKKNRLDRSAETKVIVKHLPNRLLAKGQKQHEAALEDFRVYHMLLDEFTHVAHFDIDEYLQLNKHENVRDFVKEYLTDEHGILDKKCGAITMNWILMGDNNLKKYSPEPVPIRFTCGGARIHHGMKPFFRTDAVSKLWVHAVYYDHPPVFDARPKKSGWHTCTTDNRTTTDWNFHNGPRDVIQLNHYQAKSWPENLHTRSRGSSVSGGHASSRPLSEIVKWFNTVNLNEAPELRTRNYFLKHVYKLSDEEIENYPLMEGSQCPYNGTPVTMPPTPAPPPPSPTGRGYPMRGLFFLNGDRGVNHPISTTNMEQKRKTKKDREEEGPRKKWWNFWKLISQK